MAQQVKILGACPEQKTAFDASTEPLIAIAAYFARVCTYSRISPETIVCAYINLKKVCREHPQFELTNYNAHRLFVASTMIFAKYYDDDIDSNARWARIAGVAVQELNCLEIDFLNLCQFDLAISCDTFHHTIHELLCFHYHEPMRTQVPLFHPTTTFYRSRTQSTDEPRTPSPPQNVIATPKARYSLKFTRHHHSHHSTNHHSTHSNHDSHHETDSHPHESSHHGDDSSENSSTQAHHRRKSLAVLMSLFHRHHSHHQSTHSQCQHEEHPHPDNTSGNMADVVGPLAKHSPPTSPHQADHGRRTSSGKGMQRNHSALSLSGLMHALSPGGKPFVRKPSGMHLSVEPEVDK